MRNLSSLNKWLIGLIILFIAGCGGTWVGNPTGKGGDTSSGQGYIRLKLARDNYSLLNEITLPHKTKDGAQKGSIILTEARVIMDYFCVSAGDSQTCLTWNKPPSVDLTQSSFAIAEKVTVEAGSYNNITLVTENLLLKGEYSDDTTTSPINYVLTDRVELRLQRSEVTEIKANETTVLNVYLKMDNWFNFTGKATDFSATVPPTLDDNVLKESLIDNISIENRFDKSSEGANEPERN